jgi:hypothetical protein
VSNNNNQTPIELAEDAPLPPQESATDTSNWDERSFTTPTGRVVIETDQQKTDKVHIAE